MTTKVTAAELGNLTTWVTSFTWVVTMSFSERLKQVRALAPPGTSARTVDRLAGLTPGHTSLIEGGLRLNVEARTAEALARVFGVSLDWLISGIGDAPSARRVRAALSKALEAESSTGTDG